MSSYRLSAAIGTLADVESLGLPIPLASPAVYTDYWSLGSGGVRGMGGLTCEWRFPYITYAQIAILRTYCTGESESVKISTLASGGVYDDFTATMIWPQQEIPKVNKMLDFVITFKNMVAI
jgi:hypothetical protein